MHSPNSVLLAARPALWLTLVAGLGLGGAKAPAGNGSVAIIDGKEVAIPDIKMGDRDTVRRIIEEGHDRSQVMDHIRHLTKDIGPRLTGSSNARKANEWCKGMYTLWGLDSPHLEQWGTIPV